MPRLSRLLMLASASVLVVLALGSTAPGSAHATTTVPLGSDPGWNGSGKIVLSELSGSEPRIVYDPPHYSGQYTEFMFYLGTSQCTGLFGAPSGELYVIMSNNEFSSVQGPFDSGVCAYLQTGATANLDATYDPVVQGPTFTGVMFVSYRNPSNGNAYVLKVTPPDPGLATPDFLGTTSTGLTVGAGNSVSVTFDPIIQQLLVAAVPNAPQSNPVPVNVAKSGDGVGWTQLGAVTTGSGTISARYGALIRWMGTFGPDDNLVIAFSDAAWTYNGIVQLVHACSVGASSISCSGPQNLNTYTGPNYSTIQPQIIFDPTQGNNIAVFESVWASPFTLSCSGCYGSINYYFNISPGNVLVLSETTQTPPTFTYIPTKNILLLAWRGIDSAHHLNVEPQNQPSRGASFVQQTPPPASMCTGQTAQVSEEMQNTGSTFWAPPLTDPYNPFRLGAQNPQDNSNWGLGRVNLAVDYSSINEPGPGDPYYTFSFTITAPSTPGVYNFQWQMVQEGVTWFGDQTPNVQVTVVACSLSVTANPSSVPADGSTTSTMTVQTSNNQPSVTVSFSTNLGLLSASSCTTAAGGSCSVTIKSSSSGIATVTASAPSYSSRSSTVIFTDFTVSASPTNVLVNVGSTGASTINVSALNGFSGTVNLALSISPATGLTCTLSPASITGSGSSTLSCSGSAGSYTVTITGSSGTLSHSTTVTYNVQDFSLNTSPSSVSLTLASSSASSTVTVGSLGGFSSAVSLTFSTSPAGPVVSLWPASVTPSSGGSATSTLDISAGGATPGTYTITVTGTSGSLVHTATVTVTVTGDFSVIANPTSLTIPAGSTGTSTLTLTSLNGFSGTITLASSASVSITAVSIDDGYCRSFGLLFDQQLNYPDFWNSQPNSVIGTGCSSFSYSNSYSLSSGSHFLEFGVSAWVGHWHVQITVNGVLMANVDTAIFSHVHVPFQISALSVSPVVTNGPAGSLSATSTTLSAGGSSTITLTVTTTSSTPPQNYVFTLTATSGGLSHTTTVTVQVVDFSITTSPSSSSLTLAGSSTTSTVTVASLNGFSGTVSLAPSTSPTGPVVSLWPNSLTISSGGSATSTLSISAGAATPGTYTATVTGTSGGLSHSATVTITVSGDFGISASPTSLSVKVGKSATSTITLTSLNSFAGTISFSNQASISISATTTDDPYCRSFGLLIDQQLNYPDFWNSQPNSVIGTGCSSFSYSNTYTLTTGSHFLEFGVSAFVGHWHVQITVNGVVMANVDSDLSHHVHVAFNVGGVSITPVVTSGPTASFTSPTVTISAAGSGITALTVFTAHSTPTGTYTVTVTATSGGLSHTVTITVTVV